MFPLCSGFLKRDAIVFASLRTAQVIKMSEMVENLITTKLGFRAALVFVKCLQRFPVSFFSSSLTLTTYTQAVVL